MARLNPVWSRLFSVLWDNIIVLIGLMIGIVLVNLLLASMIKLFHNSNYKRPSSYLPIVLIPILIADLRYNPLKISLDELYGKVLYEAHYEGGMSNGKFTLRENDKFEIYYAAAPFSQAYWIGTYTQDGDTLYLDYRGQKPPFDTGIKALKIDGQGIVLSDINNEINKHRRPLFWEIKQKN